MKVRAPGKLVLSGAYAVLEGAPAIVLAVDRFAVADAYRRDAFPPAEVRHALGSGAPACDVAALLHEGQKLGLGSSAAALVAAIGASEAACGASLDDEEVRRRIFARARAAHAAVQSGGSGVDVAASTYGGALRYVATNEPTIDRISLPRGFSWRAYFAGRSARTSDMRARLAAFASSKRDSYASHMRELRERAQGAASALSADRADAAVAAVRAFGESLARLGHAADSPIVPEAFRRLSSAAAEDGASFTPAGAGGGDIGVYCGTSAPSSAFERLALELSMIPLSLSLTPHGVSLSS